MKPWEGKHYLAVFGELQQMIEEGHTADFASGLIAAQSKIHLALKKDWGEKPRNFCDCCQMELDYCITPANKTYEIRLKVIKKDWKDALTKEEKENLQDFCPLCGTATGDAWET